MINKKSIIILSLILIFSGCKSVESVLKKYDEINYRDGIEIEEAKTIAQKSFLDLRFKGPYNVYKPQVLLHASSSSYPNFWFVVFPVIHPQYGDAVYLIVVDKYSGGVLRSLECPHGVPENLEKIFK